MAELFLAQLEPGPVALQKGIDSLLAGLEARQPGGWKVLSPPDWVKGPGIDFEIVREGEGPDPAPLGGAG